MINSLKARVLFVLICLPLMASAAVTHWNIVPKESSLKFTATQNGAPVSGEFKKFSGDINFSPDDLANSHIMITIEMASVADSYNQLQNTLSDKNWFNVAVFPKAVFKSTQIVRVDAKTYEAKGSLTIRDKTAPVSLIFTQQEYAPTHAIMAGTAMLKRTQFGVGQGEWADTHTIKDDVKVEFTIDAVSQ